jgi:hypothetical protein
LAILNHNFINNPVFPVAFLNHTDFTGAITWFSKYSNLLIQITDPAGDSLKIDAVAFKNLSVIICVSPILIQYSIPASPG